MWTTPGQAPWAGSSDMPASFSWRRWHGGLASGLGCWAWQLVHRPSGLLFSPQLNWSATVPSLSSSAVVSLWLSGSGYWRWAIAGHVTRPVIATVGHKVWMMEAFSCWRSAGGRAGPLIISVISTLFCCSDNQGGGCGGAVRAVFPEYTPELQSVCWSAGESALLKCSWARSVCTVDGM